MKFTTIALASLCLMTTACASTAPKQCHEKPKQCAEKSDCGCKKQCSEKK